MRASLRSAQPQILALALAFGLLPAEAHAHGEVLLLIVPTVFIFAGVLAAAFWKGPKWARYLMVFMPLVGVSLSMAFYIFASEFPLVSFVYDTVPLLGTVLLLAPGVVVPVLFARFVGRTARRRESN